MENKYENLFSEIENKILLLIIQAKIMNDLTDIRNKYLSKKGEFSVLMNKIKEADDKYYELRDKFVSDYGSYHLSYYNDGKESVVKFSDLIDSFFKLF